MLNQDEVPCPECGTFGPHMHSKPQQTTPVAEALRELRADLLRVFDEDAPCRNWVIHWIDRAAAKAQEQPMPQEPRVRVRIDRQEFSVARDAEITHDEAIRMVGKDPESTLLYWIRGPGQSDTAMNVKTYERTTLLVLDGEERAYFTAPRIINQSAAKAQEPAPVGWGELRRKVYDVLWELSQDLDDDMGRIATEKRVRGATDRILAILLVQAPAQGDADKKLRDFIDWMEDSEVLGCDTDTVARLVEEAKKMLAEGKADDRGDAERKELAITADFDTPQLRAMRLARRQIESLVCTTPGEVAIRASALEIFVRMARSF